MSDFDERDEPHTNPHLRRASGLEGHIKTVKAVVSLALTILIPFGGFAAYVIAEARASGKDAGIEVRVVAERVERVEAAQAQVNKALKEDLHEIQVDIRALYRSNQTGSRSARLEAPPPERDAGK